MNTTCPPPSTSAARAGLPDHGAAAFLWAKGSANARRFTATRGLRLAPDTAPVLELWRVRLPMNLKRWLLPVRRTAEQRAISIHL